MPETSARVQSPTERRRPEAEEIEIAVVYEDDWLIAIDKPPGMVVHPTYKNWSGTLLNALLWRTRGREAVVPSIITRLDKQTSGLVLAALSPVIHAKSQKDAELGRVRKEYVAVVEGVPVPDTGTIALPLARSAADRRRVIVIESGQPSETRYQVLSTDGRESVVRCELVTGRTHQIRVHLAALGWPLVGDEVYGRAHRLITRQALHAWRVRLAHPVTGTQLEIEAPMPHDLQQLLADQNLTL